MDLLLIDNSNIFIGLNRFGYRARIDYIKFVKEHTGNANQRKVLAGSTPPPNDSFWKTMENNGFEVYTYERTKSGEKGVDGKILVEGMEHISETKNPGDLIIMSGDLDMRSLIEKAYSRKWKIILWSWKDSINSEYVSGDLSWCVKEIHYLDDVADEVVYFNDGTYPKEYLGERELRLEREGQELRLNKAKQSAKNKIKSLQYITNQDDYLIKIDEIIDFEQISEVNNILNAAQIEDNKLKKVAEVEAAEQRCLQEERERQDKEAKKQARKEFWEKNWGYVAGGVTTVVGGIVWVVKEIKKNKK
ncbi:TPA: NYN domain-containing protein [Streptococcus suis]|uniref:NYN domain n=1 Tax=Streptococcus suis TaxID=1307 RepID=A0A116LJ56_STRSU|nr:NYN domain-containing protein [Streptococcus suis]NQH94965.1 NYN domain-containing protein [Streptococcus suis]CYU95502.1 NYN domain [Streptococcus suis]HEL1617924.1 NYN domain-containing protein [Streptococcus suis]HEL2733376.1 NYN domain-containing protein [Streptococcus suis]HEP1790451.1 NYN domain-containing protein [Streptococcus suis]